MIDCKDAGSKKQVRQGTCAARVSLTGRRRSAASVAAPSTSFALQQKLLLGVNKFIKHIFEPSGCSKVLKHMCKCVCGGPTGGGLVR